MARWQTVKVGDVCIVERGGSPRPIDKYITTADDGVNWIKIGDTTDSMYITATEQKIIPEGVKKSRYVQPGDFLLSNSMSFGRPYILKIDGCIHDGWLVLRDKDNLFDKRFLYYYLSAPSTYQKFKNLAVGGVVNNLNSEMVRNVSVPLPSLVEQKNVATLFEKISDLISLRKQQLAKLDELIKARFVEMFGDPKDVNSSWTLSSVGEQFSVTSGGTPSTVRPELWDNGTISWIGSNMCHDSILYENDGKFITELGLEQSSAKVFEAGTVLVALVGATIGKVALLRFSTATNQNVAAIDVISNEQFTSEFVFYVVQFLYSKFQEIGSGKFKMANQGFIKDLPLICPPIDLQNRFSIFVRQIERQKLTIQQSLDKLMILKKSLMQEYFG